MPVKQVIVLRKDLNMRKGKLVAQGAHASLKVFTDQSSFGKHDIPLVGGVRIMRLELWPYAQEWMAGLYTKICLGCESEIEIQTLANQAKDAGLPHALITDAGLTEFAGVPTVTALAIGPWDSDEIDKITGRLKLM